MLKFIEYAYATSSIANKLGAGETGCYYVGCRQRETDIEVKGIRGPFDTLEGAERHASAIDAEWSRYTKRANAESGQ